jgi:hypothetical protein
LNKLWIELISEEAGMKFQGLAAVLAKQKWRRLVACERKWDLGLDAHASGELEADGRGMGLACSLTGEYGKIASEGQEELSGRRNSRFRDGVEGDKARGEALARRDPQGV